MPHSKESKNSDNFSEEIQTFDNIIESVGGTGRFQAYIFFCSVILETTASSCIIYFIYEGANPGWSCPANFTPTENGTNDDRCVSGSPCENFVFDDRFTSILTEWSLLCGSWYKVKLTASCMFGGLMIGAFSGGQVSDLYGRKLTLLAYWIMLIIIQMLLPVATYWEVYTVMRFFVGVCAGSMVAITTVLVSEYIGPKWRSITAWRIGWQLGPAILVTTSYFSASWKITAVVCGGIGIPFLPIFYFYLPESSRWLLQRHRYEEAHRWLKMAAKMNKYNAPNIQTLKRVAENQSERSQNGHGTKYSYLDLFRTPRFTLISAAVMYSWFSVSLVSYGVSSQLADFSGSIHLNMVISISMSVLTRWTAIFIINWVGRRYSFSLYLGLTTIFLIAVLIMMLCKSNPVTVGIVASAGSTLNSGSWGVAVLFASEQFPTLLRNVATGSGNVAARIAGIIAPQIGVLGKYHETIPFIIYIIVSVTGMAFTAIVLPETKGKPLPEKVPHWDWPCRRDIVEEESAHPLEAIDSKINRTEAEC